MGAFCYFVLDFSIDILYLKLYKMRHNSELSEGEISKLLQPKKVNYNSPKFFKKLERLEKEQKKILKSAEVNPNELLKLHFGPRSTGFRLI